MSISFSRTHLRLSRDGEHRHVVKDLVLVVGALQVVVRDPRVEVVDVVQADVAGEELQRLRQLQVRAALKRGVVVAPAVVALPVDVLELMLDVEQPDARPCRRGRRAGARSAGTPSIRAARRTAAIARAERQVGEGDAVAQPLALVERAEPRADHQRPDRPEPEHHQRDCETAGSRGASARAARSTRRRSASARRPGRGDRGRRRCRGGPRGRGASSQTVCQTSSAVNRPTQRLAALASAGTSRGRSRERR